MSGAMAASSRTRGSQTRSGLIEAMMSPRRRAAEREASVQLSTSTSPYWLTGSPIQESCDEAGDALGDERPDHDEAPGPPAGDDGELAPAIVPSRR